VAKPIPAIHQEKNGVKTDLRPRCGEPVVPDDHPSDSREMGIYLTLAQVGLEMVAPLIVGLVIDYYANWGPWAALSGIVLGFVGGICHIVVLSNKQEAAMRKKKPPGDDLP
jgi:F0F1-type ATP synthase assembly protein I